jgi:hypothetical protein
MRVDKAENLLLQCQKDLVDARSQNAATRNLEIMAFVDVTRILRETIVITNTTRIRLFTECSALCRVLFCRALGKFQLSVMTVFTESRTLGKETFAECQTLGEWRRSAKGRQQPSIADGRYLYRAPSFGTQQRSFFTECQTAKTRQSMLCQVPFFTLGKVYFYFFIFPTKLFGYVPTLCRPTCIILIQL